MGRPARFKTDEAWFRVKAALERSRGDKWRGRLAVPKRAHPLVRQMYMLINEQRVTLKEVAARVGCRFETISDWRYRATPNLTTFVAAANALGYDLRIVRRKDSSLSAEPSHPSSDQLRRGS